MLSHKHTHTHTRTYVTNLFIYLVETSQIKHYQASHIAVFGAMRELSDGKVIPDSNIFNFDTTGSAIQMEFDEHNRYMALLDAPPEGKQNKPNVTRKQGTKSYVNAKLVTCSNGEGKGMEQVYIMQHQGVDRPQRVILTDEGNDNQDIVVYFTPDRNLENQEVLALIFENEVMKFIDRSRAKTDRGEQIPCILTVDGNPVQITAIEQKFEQMCNEKGIRLGKHSASQTPIEQAQDAGSMYKDHHSKVHSWCYHVCRK